MSGHTYIHTHIHTRQLQSPSLCACAPRVNYYKLFEALKLIRIIELVDSINRDERGFPLTQYITNWGISRAR